MSDFADKSTKLITLFSLISALVFFILGRWLYGFGVLVGAAWSGLNFIFLLSFPEIALKAKSKKLISLLILTKFPVLYLIGFIILFQKFLPVSSLILGFSIGLITTGAVFICRKRK